MANSNKMVFTETILKRKQINKSVYEHLIYKPVIVGVKKIKPLNFLKKFSLVSKSGFLETTFYFEKTRKI